MAFRAPSLLLAPAGALFVLISWILCASLQSGVTWSARGSKDAGPLLPAVKFECSMGVGLFVWGRVGGPSCPATFSVSDDSTRSAICKGDEDDCTRIKVGQAFIVIACVLSGLGFLGEVGIALNKGRRFLFLSFMLWFVVFVFGFATFILFEVRSRAEEDGWAQDYGCYTGSIPSFGQLSGLSGQYCFRRGAAYAFLVLGWVFSLCLALLTLAKAISAVARQGGRDEELGSEPFLGDP